MLQIDIHQISKGYQNVQAVNNVSFSVHSGQIVALLGPNGAGKSSLIRMLVGLTRPDHGHINIQAHGQAYTQLPMQSFGYLPEDRGLYPDQTVEQNLKYIATLRHVSAEDYKIAMDRWLPRFDLLEKRHEKLAKLSKGNQQKVQLISCILHQPALLILDEPFSGLDPINQEHVVAILQELRQQGCAILLSAHQMALVERLADQMILLNRGHVVAQGDLAAVTAQLAGPRLLQAEFQTPADFAAIAALPAVQTASPLTAQQVQLTVDPAYNFTAVITQLSSIGELVDICRVQPSLHELYLTAIKQHNAQFGQVTPNSANSDFGAETTAEPAQRHVG